LRGTQGEKPHDALAIDRVSVFCNFDLALKAACGAHEQIGRAHVQTLFIANDYSSSNCGWHTIF
jgi:hypothetical protein